MDTDPDPPTSNDLDLLERIREEADQAFKKDTSRNNLLTIIIVILALGVAAVWGILFWNSDDPKFQLLWGLFFVGELIGVALSVIMYLVEDAKITLQCEHRRLELQLLDLQERLPEPATDHRD